MNTENQSKWDRFKNSLNRADSQRKSSLIRYFFDVNVLSPYIIKNKVNGSEEVECCQTELIIPALGCPIHHFGER